MPGEFLQSSGGGHVGDPEIDGAEFGLQEIAALIQFFLSLPYFLTRNLSRSDVVFAADSSCRI